MNVEQVLIDMHIPVYRFSLRLVRDPERAADIAQETMCRAWQHRDQFSTLRSVKSWLFRIAANLARDGFRQMQRRAVLQLDSEVIDCSAIPDEVVAGNELQQELLQCLTELPRRQAEVIHLRVVEQLSIAEIAEVLDLKAHTVRANLAAARQQMRKRFARHPIIQAQDPS